MEEHGVLSLQEGAKNLAIPEPLGQVPFIKLVGNRRLMIKDSGSLP